MNASTAQKLEQLRRMGLTTGALRECFHLTADIIATAHSRLAQGYDLNVSARENMMQTADTLSASDEMVARSPTVPGARRAVS